MKKIIKFTTGLTFQILLLSAIGMIGTFLSDYLVDLNWFNDYTEISNKYSKPFEDDIWGARHYWYNITVSVLFVIQGIRIVLWSFAYWSTDFQEQINK